MQEDVSVNSLITHIAHHKSRERFLRLAASLACILLLCTACTANGDNETTPPPDSRILIAYLAGDNNLSAEVEQKITALATGFLHNSNPETGHRLFIYSDSRNVPPQLIEITNTHNGPLRIVKTYPPHNSANAEVMAQVLDDVLGSYPANGYGLILFSHGTAWLPPGGLNNPYTAPTEMHGTHGNTEAHGNIKARSSTEARRNTEARTIAVDGGNELELTDFAQALPLPGGKKWDFILFENCYMASIEVAYELKDKTEAIVASPTEILSPGMTEVYPTALHHLYKETPALESFAQAYFDHWNAKWGDYRSATVSVIRTARLEELAALARAAFVRWQPDTETIDAMQRFNRNRWHLFFDLEEAMLTANPALKPHIDHLLPHIVTYAAATPAFIPGKPYGFDINHHCGLTCYLFQLDFFFINQKFRQLSWSTVVSP